MLDYNIGHKHTSVPLGSVLHAYHPGNLFVMREKLHAMRQAPEC